MIGPGKTSTGATRQHFEILDGLRGIAAIVVVIFHFMEIVYTDYSKNFAGHGFLAVDFFFCLSGFVIAYAYDNRMEQLGTWSFFKARLIRLHPLVILGSVLGLLTFLFNPLDIVPPLYGFWGIALIFLTSLLIIPFPVMAERYFNLFSFNAPAWSLFWEYVANIFYGLVLWKLPRWVLAILAVAAAVALGFVAHKAGNLMGGWSKDTFWQGGARIAYSFLAGLLVYRFQLVLRNKLGFIGMAILLLFSLMMPYIKLNWLAELAVVLICFPLLISLGAGARLHEGLRKICVFSGRISYPLYMTHYGFLWIFANYYQQYKPGTGQLTLVVTVSVLLLTALAWLAMKFYDDPVRKYLSAKKK